MTNNPKANELPRYFSMFSGVGGFELGIGDMAECIGYSEIDKYAIETYERHYKHENYGDATLIDERGLPDFDLLVGGFPCQAFSIAGKRKGFDDTRGTLFFDIARILQHKRPSHLFLENVKGLLSHDNGKTFQTILGVLADLGYGVEWQLLNGKRWVPQNRERVIIIGHLREECRRKVLPIRNADRVYPEPNETEKEMDSIASTQTARQYASWGGNFLIENSARHEPRVYETTAPSVQASYGTGGGHVPLVVPVLTPDRPVKRQNGRRFKENGEPSFTLNTQDKHGIFDGVRIRRLTPLECERLMGWPDNWTEGVSDTQRYKQCGNGIIAPMVTEVITALCNEGCLQTEGTSRTLMVRK